MTGALTKNDRFLGGLWGSLTGDALGVPVEFSARPTVLQNPVTGMRAFGTHHQPVGTWSDDSSLLLCTAESLVKHEFSLDDIAQRFLRWVREAYWSPHGDVFDIGIATSQAISRYAQGMSPMQCGGRGEQDNGNGSLMRILPVCLRFANADLSLMLTRVEAVSSITPAHPRSLMACGLFGLVTREILAGVPAPEALSHALPHFQQRYADRWPEEMSHFSTIGPALENAHMDMIDSSGYVIHTLTASLWCLLTTGSYSECVLKAVNLGGDTDTTGCVAGGLAGVYYGLDAIPREWLDALARKEDVARLFNQFVS